MDLKKYVEEHLAQGDDVAKIKLDLAGIGIDEADVNLAIKESLSKKDEQKSEVKVEEKVEEKGDGKKKIKIFGTIEWDLTKSLLLVGGILILAAMIYVVAVNWYDVGPVGKILFMTLPTGAIFLIAALLANNEIYEEVSNFLLVLGGVLAPFTIGTILLQTKVFSYIDDTSIITILLISLAGYLLMEIFYRKPLYAILVGLDVLVLYGVWGEKITQYGDSYYDYSSSYTVLIWGMFIIALLIAVIGRILLRKKLADGKYYSYVGFGAMALSFPWALISSLEGEYYSSSAGSWSWFVAGILYLVTAMGLNAARREWNDGTYYHIKRAFEEVAVWVIPFSLLTLVGASDGAWFLMVLIGAGYMAASMKISIKSLLLAGVLSLIIGLFGVGNVLFEGSAGWPVMMFLAGFLSIGVGVWVRKIRGYNKEHGIPAIWMGLGREVGDEGVHIGWGWVLFIIPAFYAVLWVIRGIFMSFI